MSLKTVIYRWLTANAMPMAKWEWRAIGMCFLTACTFWIFNALNAEHTTSLAIPLSLHYNEKKLAMLSQPPEEVHANVTGYGWSLLKKGLGIGLEPVAIDAPYWKINHLTTKAILPTVAEHLGDLKVNYILEDSLFFQLDTIVSHTVPIEVSEADIPLAAGMKLVSNIVLSPDQVLLRGPASLLALPVYRSPAGLHFKEEAIRTNFDGYATVAMPHPDDRVYRDERVKVRFKVDHFLWVKAPASVVFENVPPGTKLSIAPDSAHVEYWLRQGELMMEEGVARLLLDYRNINWEDSTLAPILEVPSKYLDPVSIPTKFKLNIAH